MHSSPYLPQVVADQSFVSFGLDRLRPLCEALEFGSATEKVSDIFRTLTLPWGDRLIGKQPFWPSEIVDDHTPFEFSIVLGGTSPEVRILVEAQAEQPSLDAYQEASLRLTNRLLLDFGINLDRFERIQDLFLPANPQGDFAMWHAACCWPDRNPEFKCYLNPQVYGPEHAAEVIREALYRLGMARVWPTLVEHAAGRGQSRNEFKYFALDLSNHALSRVKVYFRHHNPTVEDLEAAVSSDKSLSPGDIRRFCMEILGSEGPFLSRVIASCFSVVEGESTLPSSATLYIPISHYVENDQVALERICSYLDDQELAHLYRRALNSFAMRPLEHARGIQSHISFQRKRGKSRITAYLAPEAYRAENTMLYQDVIAQ